MDFVEKPLFHSLGIDWSLDKLQFYNVGHRPIESFGNQVRALGAPIVIENFLSEEEISQLIDVEALVPLEDREIRPPDEKISCTNGPWHLQPCLQAIRLRIESVIGPFDVWGGNYFDVSFPYLPHVDNGENLKRASFKNIVLPLKTDPPNKRTQLVLFRQRYFGGSTGFFRSGRILEREITATGALVDYSTVLFVDTDGDLDSEFIENSLAHIDPENLRGLTIEAVIPWTVGSLIVFDSSQIHCATDFRKEGIVRKTGLSLFTHATEL